MWSARAVGWLVQRHHRAGRGGRALGAPSRQQLLHDAAATVRDFRRQQIVGESRRIVAELGLQALTFGTLERRLSFTRGVITYHFRNKEDLVHAVLDSAIEEIDADTASRTRSEVEGAAKVHATIDAVVKGFLEREEATRVLLSFWGRLQADPRAAEKNARLYERYRSFGRKVLADACSEAGVDVPTQALSVSLVAVIIGIVAQATFEPGAVDVDEAVAEASQLFCAPPGIVSATARDRTRPWGTRCSPG